MPRFFFDIGDGEQARDDMGVELPDASAARISALRYAAELLDAHPELLSGADDWWLSIRDAGGAVVAVIHIELGAGAPVLSERRVDGDGAG